MLNKKEYYPRVSDKNSLDFPTLRGKQGIKMFMKPALRER